MNIRFYLSILCILTVLFPFTSCTKTINAEQLVQLKQDKQFWTWNSSQGAFDIHYIEKGHSSNQILLIHGFGAYSYSWRSIIDPLVEAGYHVWAIDLIGFGLSDKPENVRYGLDLFLEQISAFMKAKQIAKADFIGNSMGGGLVLGMAIHHPQQVHSLTLIDALGYPLDLPFPLAITKLAGNFTKPLQGQFIVRRILEQVMYDPTKVTEEQVEAYTLPLTTPGGPEAFIATLKNFDNKQIEALNRQFKTIQAPVLIIWGEQDKWIPLNYYREFVKDFPQAKTLVIPNCGHIPQEECPKEVVNAILPFLKSV